MASTIQNTQNNNVEFFNTKKKHLESEQQSLHKKISNCKDAMNNQLLIEYFRLRTQQLNLSQIANRFQPFPTSTTP